MVNVEIRLGAEYEDGKFEGYTSSFYIDGKMSSGTRWLSKEGVVFSAHQDVIERGVTNPQYRVISDPKLSRGEKPRKKGYSLVGIDDKLKKEILELLNSKRQFRKSKREIENPRIRLESIVILRR